MTVRTGIESATRRRRAVSPKLQIMAMPVPLSLRQLVRDDRDLNAEQRGRCRRSRADSAVVGMGDEGDHRDSGRVVDPDVGGVADTGEAELVVGARHLLVLELGLGDGGLEGDVPQRRRLDLVRLTGVQVVEERQLADAPAVVVDRPVGAGPVDRQPKRKPSKAFILDRELDAQFDEVGSADGDGRTLPTAFGSPASSGAVKSGS